MLLDLSLVLALDKSKVVQSKPDLETYQGINVRATFVYVTPEAFLSGTELCVVLMISTNKLFPAFDILARSL